MRFIGQFELWTSFMYQLVFYAQVSRVWYTREGRDVNPREHVRVGYCHLSFGAPLAQPEQLGCAADFERFWLILGPKFNRVPCFLV